MMIGYSWDGRVASSQLPNWDGRREDEAECFTGNGPPARP